MSQKVTLEVALTLKKGDRLYHNIIEFGGPGEDKTPATAVVTGKCKVLKHNVEVFDLPIHREYCGGSKGSVSRMSEDLWRTTPERVYPVARAHRTRPVEASPNSDEDTTPAPTRMRRTRVTVTGRVIDEDAERQRLVGVALDQMQSLRRRERVRRTR